jgi:Transglycosylase SLT domain
MRLEASGRMILLGYGSYLGLIVHLAAGALAIAAPEAPLSVERALDYAFAAAEMGARRGVDPFELVAIARHESDFHERARGPDGKDCGLTQTRVTISRYSCRQLRASYQLAFEEAARELSEYARACRDRRDFDRCRLNHYNSGAHYARRGFHGAYWLRVTCFAEAAKSGVPVGGRCRRARVRTDLPRILRQAREQPMRILSSPPAAARAGLISSGA